MGAFIPLRHTIEVYTPGEMFKDRFNNLRPGPGTWKTIRVAAWFVGSTEERDSENASILRTVDTLTIYCAPEQAPPPGGKVRIPGSGEWEVEGHAEDYRHGPWWDPGLVVVHAKKVEG